MGPDEMQSTVDAPGSSHRPAVERAFAPQAGAAPERDLRGLGSAIGNRSFMRALSRMEEGAGILAGGVVHPSVEAAIAAASGGGRSLDGSIAAHAGGALGDSFDDVRVHHDEHAAALSRAVAARAFTVGHDIFFGAGEYRPHTTDGRQLLAHELAHVVQQRDAADVGPLTVSQPGDALERQADDTARGVF